jgi:predicted acylesterase/phospholipase RssA
LGKAKQIWEDINLQGNKRFITSILKSAVLPEIIESLVVDTKIENTFYVPLLDLSERELHYQDFSTIMQEDIQQYLSASITIPFLTRGVAIGEKTLYDGAVVDNIPIYPVLKKELDYIICIYFDDVHYIFEDYDFDNKVIRLTFPDNKIISNSVCIEHDSIMYMIEEGYRRTKEIMTFIFSDGTDALDAIHERIARLNADNDNNKIMRITGDVIVTNLNKIAQKVICHNKIIEKDSIQEFNEVE